MKKVCVIGGGTMGMDIAQVLAANGIPVTVKAREITDKYIQKAESGLNKSLTRLCEKGIIDAAAKASTLSLISFTANLHDAADCDLVIEAIVEDADIKKQVFSALDEICKSETIFATNTSSISITELSGATSRPDRFLGMHFFNPASMMKLVEIVRGISTSDETVRAIYEFSEYIGKEPIEVIEAPGFVVNRILIPMINEAIGVLADAVTTAEKIDRSMRLGANHPMGPLALSDLIGNDVVLSILDTLLKETGDNRYRAHPMLRKMVRGKLLGKKSGKGFYDYSKKP